MTHFLSPGIYAAALTPLHENLSINHEELFWHCHDLIQRGCQGIVLFGTTGEGPSFSVSERIETVEKLASEGFEPNQIVLGNGSSGISDTVVLIQMAVKKGFGVVLISPPSYYKHVKDEGVIAYYREIIQRVDHPNFRILLYHFPQMTGVSITLHIIEILRKEFPNVVVGIKESEGNLALTKTVLARFPGFQVFVGNELHIVEAVQHGGAGSICGIANLYPELIRALYEHSQDFHLEKLKSIFRALKGCDFIPAAKSVMEMHRGVGWHTLYPPLVPFSVTQREDFLKNLQPNYLENGMLE